MKEACDKKTTFLSTVAAAFLAMLVLSAQGAVAGGFSATVQPGGSGKDTYIVSSTPNQNFGAGVDMDIKGDDNRRVLVQFDLSGIPSNAIIRTATLALYVTATGTPKPVVNITRVTTAWDEGTGNGDITKDGATWKNASGAKEWTTSGGDFDSKIWATTTITEASRYFTWDVTELVRSWANGTYANYGLLVRTDTFNSGITTFPSGDNANASIRPNLTVTYVTPPAWSGQAQNTSTPASGGTVGLSVFWEDNSTLGHAWLATNETGSWQNRSGAISINAASGWSNFSWQNGNMAAGTAIGWRAYANNSDGLASATDVMTFTISRTTSAVNLFLNGRPADLSVTVGETVNITAALAIPAEGNVSISVNGTTTISGPSPLQSTGNFTEAGTFPISASYAGDQNHTAGSATLYLTVTFPEQPPAQAPTEWGVTMNPTNTTQAAEIPACPACPLPTGWSECLNGKQGMATYLCNAATGYSCLLITDERRCKGPTAPTTQPAQGTTPGAAATGLAPTASATGPVSAMPGLAEVTGLTVAVAGGLVLLRSRKSMVTRMLRRWTHRSRRRTSVASL